MLRSGHNTLLLVLLLATKIFACSKISKNTRIAYNIFPFLLHIYCITQIIFRSTHIFQVYKIFINVLHKFIFRRIFCYTSYKMLQISAHFLDFHSNGCSEFCPFNGPLLLPYFSSMALLPSMNTPFFRKIRLMPRYYFGGLIDFWAIRNKWLKLT